MSKNYTVQIVPSGEVWAVAAVGGDYLSWDGQPQYPGSGKAIARFVSALDALAWLDTQQHLTLRMDRKVA